MKVWDIEKASNILSVGCGKGVKVVRSNNVEPVVYTGHSDGSLRVYSITQGNKPVSHITGVLDYAISSMTLMSNRNQVLVTSLEGSCIHILDLKMNKSIAKFDHRDFFNSAAHAAISPSEGLVLAGNCDGSVYYWNRFKGEFMKRVSGHDSAVTAINYTFMNSMLASADKNGDLILWQ
jgi:WD40 repeat protein